MSHKHPYAVALPLHILKIFCWCSAIVNCFLITLKVCLETFSTDQFSDVGNPPF